MLISVIISIVLGVIFLLITFYSNSSHKLKAILGILGISLIFYGSYTYGAMKPAPIIETYNIAEKREIDYLIKKVEIISPIPNDTVKCRILSMGVYPENHQKDIWVLLKPSDGKYYPQSDWTNTSYKEDGRWQVVTRFGGSLNEKYEMFIYETDSTTSKFFSTTVESWKSTGDYLGLEAKEIPTDAKVVDKIEVILENDCRDIF